MENIKIRGGGGEREEKRREKKTISGQDGGMELNHKL